MDRKLKRICTIAARGGSKEVKNKNIRKILNKPLLAHTIIQAKKSGLFDCIAFSSDSALILKLAQKFFPLTFFQELLERNRWMSYLHKLI